jgi:hypothetical protein
MGRRRLGAGVAALALLTGAAALLATTPREHVAPGCFWWLASTVDRVLPGDSGCLRGWYVTSGLAESPDPASYRLSLYAPEGRTCPFRPGDAVVIRYRAFFDDGRTIVQATDCR